MDPIVLQAMAKWPNLPAVFGWLSLSARGEYLLKNEPIGNQALREFIARNYAPDSAGNWYFQNGPQRVYVALALAPWVYRVDGAGRLVTHTEQQPQHLLRVLADEDARLFFETELGPGAIDDRDTAAFAQCLVDAAGTALTDDALERWVNAEQEAFFKPATLHLSERNLICIERAAASEMAARLGYVAQPAADRVTATTA